MPYCKTLLKWVETNCCPIDFGVVHEDDGPNGVVLLPIGMSDGPLLYFDYCPFCGQRLRVPCPDCKGTKVVRFDNPQGYPQQMECAKCNGRGTVPREGL